MNRPAAQAGGPRPAEAGPRIASDEPEQELRRRIAAQGTIGFDEFMQVALYHPETGYYSGRARRTGRDGDFFTSVDVGPVFGKLLAAQFCEMSAKLGEPDDFTLVEQGANDGRLMRDVLEAWPGNAPEVVIIEPSGHRRAAQRETLAPWAGSVRHVVHEDELAPFTGVFFANELVDAFPVKLLVRNNGKWFERRVACEDSRLVFREVPLSDASALAAARSLPAPEITRFCTEWCPSLSPWMRTLAGKLRRGWILLVDYGQPAAIRCHPSRAEGQLAAYRDHRRSENPLEAPGRQDLTAHVDFTAVAQAGLQAGLQLAGFTDQHHALTALAAEVFPAMPEATLPAGAAREMRALRQLLHPESMGTLFKFLALGKNAPGPLAAFLYARDPHGQLFP